MQGRLMHLHHELMISRFHYMLDKACQRSDGRVKLLGFYQGPQLWNEVEVSRLFYDENRRLVESDENESLPHRPDAFFGLHFPDRDGEEKTQYFFYEADRRTTSIKKMQNKLRAHFHYVVKQKKHAEDYGVKRIRAVLVESINDSWTNSLRIGAKHPVVTGSRPSPLFWFTTSDVVFEQPIKVRIKGVEKEIPRYLEKPELVLSKIWATPLHDEGSELLSLID